jgi:hypothetical protein
MSIFRDTLKPEVIAQLRAREKVISSEDSNVRNNQLVGYMSKNSWVKMTSLVDYDSWKDIEIGYNNIVNYKQTGYYTGNELSKKYVLFGGTPYTNRTNDQQSLRGGVDKLNALYGSDLDIPAYQNIGAVNRPLGIRPTPGISSVDIYSKSAYGSLREAQIKFYCWDKHQLEELEILFMRPGYSVLLEWGWSKYIDYNDSTAAALSSSLQSGANVNVSSNNLNISPFTTPFIDAYSPNLSQELVLNLVDEKIKKSRSNYDAMLGYVRNFNWTLLSNGGYECTTTLISVGEVISSLKISSNPNESTSTPNNLLSRPNEIRSYEYTDYEKVLLSLKARVDQNDFISGSYTGVDFSQVQTSINDIGSRFQDRDIIRKTSYKLVPLFNEISSNNQPYIKKYDSTDEDTVNQFNEYISFNMWLAIMDAYFMLKTDDKQAYVYFDINNPSSNPTYCLAAPDSVSVDPSVCYVDNSNAFPEIQALYTQYASAGNTGILSKLLKADQNDRTDVKDFYLKNKKLGVLEYVNINVDFLLKTFKSMNSSTNNDGVDVLSYVQNVLNGISTALGGLNNFKVFTNNNVIKIGDVYYVEDPSNRVTSKKFQFDLMGLKSICRDVKITSRIFPEQSTMIAIAAQNKGNIGDIYSSTQTLFNAGLTDRIAKNKDVSSTPDNSSHTPVTISGGGDKLYNKLLALVAYLRYYVIGNADFNSYSPQYSITSPNNPPASSSALRTFLLQFNPDINFKALIPFELSLTLDGIGGFVIGQIFTINKNILPRDYYNKKLGFIITGISHDLSKNDWTTTLKTQICLLDDGKLSSNLTKLTTALTEARKQASVEAVNEAFYRTLNFLIIRDFITYQAIRAIVTYMFDDIPEGELNKNASTYLEGNILQDEPISNAAATIRATDRQLALKKLAQNTTGVLDYYNINIFEFGQARGTEFNWPVKQQLAGGGSTLPDNYGISEFAQYWIDNTLNNASNNDLNANFNPTPNSNSLTFREVLNQYKTEIESYRTTYSWGSISGYSGSYFIPDYYTQVREDLGTGNFNNVGRDKKQYKNILNGYNGTYIINNRVFSKTNETYNFYGTGGVASTPVTTGVWNMDTNILSTNSRDYLQTVNSNNDIANLSVLRSLSDEVLSTIPSSNWFFTNWLSKYYPLFRVQKNPDINGVDNSTNSYAYVGLDSGDYGAQTIEKFQAMTTIRPLTNSNTLRRPVNSNIQYRP